MTPLLFIKLSFTKSSLRLDGKSEETGAVENSLKGVFERRRVSSAVEGDALAVAPERRCAGITEVAERTLSCRDTSMQEITSVVASVMSIDGMCSEQLRLPCELETIAEPQGLSRLEELENESGSEKEKFLGLIDEVYDLKSSGDLGLANKRMEDVCSYINRHHDDGKALVDRFYQCKAYLSYAARDIDGALSAFKKAEQESKGPINFPEKLFVMHLMLGMSVDGNNNVFRPEEFYEEMKKWVGADKAEDDKIEQLLDIGFKEDACQVKIFRDCIKAIFEDEGAGTEAADGKFEQAITKLTNFKKSQLISRILEHSVSMLIFARKLKQIKQSDFSALNGAKQNFFGVTKGMVQSGSSELPHLDEYLCCEVARKAGFIEDAITRCEECIDEKGYPFWEYREKLMLARAQQ